MRVIPGFGRSTMDHYRGRGDHGISVANVSAVDVPLVSGAFTLIVVPVTAECELVDENITGTD
jgi:hypothetical protein